MKIENFGFLKKKHYQDIWKKMNTETLPQHALTAVGQLIVASVSLPLMFLCLFGYAWSKSLMYPSMED